VLTGDEAWASLRKQVFAHIIDTLSPVVSIDRPSTVFASLGVREIDEVGSLLDHKIGALLRGIGVDTGDALGRNTDQQTS
jgi:hypothetical protein